MVTLVQILDWSVLVGIPIALVAAYLIFKFGKTLGGVVGDVMDAFAVVAIIDALRSLVRAFGLYNLIDVPMANAFVNALRLVSLGVIIFAAVRGTRAMSNISKKPRKA
jgi:hypothetical protein